MFPIVRKLFGSLGEASLSDPALSYAAFDRHTFGDLAPYVSDPRITARLGRAHSCSDAGVRATLRCLKKTPGRPRICYFSAPDVGLFGIRMDIGKSLGEYKGHDFPDGAVRDIVVHLSESDLMLPHTARTLSGSRRQFLLFLRPAS